MLRAADENRRGEIAVTIPVTIPERLKCGEYSQGTQEFTTSTEADAHVRPDRDCNTRVQNLRLTIQRSGCKHTSGASNNVSRPRTNKIIKIEKVIRVQINSD